MKNFVAKAGLILSHFILITACSDAQDSIAVEAVKQDLEIISDVQSVTGAIYAKQSIQPVTGDIFLVNVVLAEVSKMDIAVTEIGSVSLITKHLPIEYSITIDPALIKPTMSYALQARITDETDKLVGITAQQHKYTLTDPNIDFDILVKAVQSDAPMPIQKKLTCGKEYFVLAIYPSLLVKTNVVTHNQRILPRVISASGVHFSSDKESIFIKGELTPLVEVDGESISCHFE
jgi:uncharacterized lipoprotein YbaY